MNVYSRAHSCLDAIVHTHARVCAPARTRVTLNLNPNTRRSRPPPAFSAAKTSATTKNGLLSHQPSLASLPSFAASSSPSFGFGPSAKHSSVHNELQSLDGLNKLESLKGAKYGKDGKGESEATTASLLQTMATGLKAQLLIFAESLKPSFIASRPDATVTGALFGSGMNVQRGAKKNANSMRDVHECIELSWSLASQNASNTVSPSKVNIDFEIGSFKSSRQETYSRIKTSFASIAKSQYRTPAFPTSLPFAHYMTVVSRASLMDNFARSFSSLAAVASLDAKIGAESTQSSSPSSSSSSEAISASPSQTPKQSSNSGKFSSHHSVCPDVIPDPQEILKLAGLPNPLSVPRGQLPLEYFEMDPSKDSDRTDLLWSPNSPPPSNWIPPGIEETFEEGMTRLKNDLPGKTLFILKFISMKVFRLLKNIIFGVGSGVYRYARDPSLIGPAWDNLKKVVKHEAKHYWNGFKLLMADVRTASRLALIRAQGGSLSRRERRQLVRTTSDIFRLIPFAVIVVVPFLEFALPIILKLFPNFLPSTFQDKHQQAAKIKNELKARLELADFLQDTMETLARQKLTEAKALKAATKSASSTTAAALAAVTAASQASGDSDVSKPDVPGARPEVGAAEAASAEKMMEIIKMVRSGQRVDNEQLLAVAALFQDDITLDNLSRAHLVAMCKYMKLSPYGSDTALRERLRDKVEEIREDDELIEKEGINTLTLEELREACRDRGMRVHGLTKHGLIRNITAWIDLSVHKRVPASLLLLSRALSIAERPLDETLMTALSSIDEATVDEVFSDAGLDSTDPESRLEAIRRQNDIIADEMETRRSLFSRLAKLKESEVATSAAAAAAATAVSPAVSAASQSSMQTTSSTSATSPTPVTSTPPIKLTTVSANAPPSTEQAVTSTSSGGPATSSSATSGASASASSSLSGESPSSSSSAASGETTTKSVSLDQSQASAAAASKAPSKPTSAAATTTAAASSPTTDDLTHLSDALSDLASPSAVSSEREKLKKLRAEQEEIEVIVRSPAETDAGETPILTQTSASSTQPQSMETITTITGAIATASSSPSVNDLPSTSTTTPDKSSGTSTPTSSTSASGSSQSTSSTVTGAAIAKAAADIRARATHERMLAEKKAQEAMRAKIEFEAALAKLPNKDTAMDIVLSTISQVTPGDTYNPSELPSLFWPRQQKPALPLWQAGLIDDKGKLRKPETTGQERVLNRYALRVARQMTRYLDKYLRDRQLAAQNADLARRNRHMTALSRQVNSMLNQLELRIDDADKTIGDQLHLLDKDKDGRISTRELQIVLKEHLKAASTEEEAAALVSKIKKLSASKGWYMSVDDIKRIAQEFSDLTEEERIVYLEQQEQAARHASEAQAKLHKYITATAAARHQAQTAREATMEAQRATPK